MAKALFSIQPLCFKSITSFSFNCSKSIKSFFFPATTMPGLKNHIKGLKEVFDQYADSEGNLTKDQFKKLLETEIEDEEVKVRNSTQHFT